MTIMTTKQMTCESCGASYSVTPAQELVGQQEFARMFPDGDLSQAAQVCGTCFIEFVKWMKDLGLTGRIADDADELRRLMT